MRRTLEVLLMALGLTFVVVVAAGLWLVTSWSSFQDEHETFVREFITDYSQQWELADVRERVSTNLLEQIRSPDGALVVDAFRQYGELVSIQDVLVENFSAQTHQVSGTFVFQAEFSNAPAVVKIIVVKRADDVRVDGLVLTPLEDVPLVPADEANI